MSVEDLAEALGHTLPPKKPTLLQETDDSEFGKAASDVFSEAEELLLRKNHDYGSKNISLSPGGPLNGLRVRMWDKMARINNLVDKDVEPSNESLRDSFIDLLNYSAIALMVLDGKWPE
ncbi:nucleotide modification associated domain-containing protein [Jiangella anatolica]|nr:nucleotide modification associated domain-containing protein [Jiangella anatolica]